ncbi:unnamed protein product [Rhizoctonia solani]|uniref:Protein ROT1 n=1 Tax=Rhizoctonia solani TaxID=456999 RepID=A0A8H3HQQ6_9AGAM|nr:unnamed protein product [Rhizoctonia solani]
MLMHALLTTIISAPFIFGQIVYDKDHNVTSLRGTWSTTSDGHVLTGPNFANPVDSTFSIPEAYTKITSWTYSFTDDGFWEQCTYLPQHIRTEDGCASSGAAMIYQHGTYQLNSDGSMTLTPFEQDGRYELRDPCGAMNKTLSYAVIGHIPSWSIDMDPVVGPILHLVRPHVPVQTLTQAYDPPNMLPTRPLTEGMTIQS